MKPLTGQPAVGSQSRSSDVEFSLSAGAHQAEEEQGQGRAGRQDGPGDAAEAGDRGEREAAGHGPGQTSDIKERSSKIFCRKTLRRYPGSSRKSLRPST